MGNPTPPITGDWGIILWQTHKAEKAVLRTALAGGLQEGFQSRFGLRACVSF